MKFLNKKLVLIYPIGGRFIENIRKYVNQFTPLLVGDFFVFMIALHICNERAR